MLLKNPEMNARKNQFKESKVTASEDWEWGEEKDGKRITLCS